MSTPQPPQNPQQPPQPQYGQQPPYPGPQQVTAAPPKKRKKWPWVVGGLVVLVVVFGAASGGGQGGSPTADSGGAQNSANVASSGSEQDAQSGDDGSGVTRLSFGETYTWPGGEAITISEPSEYTPSNQFMAAPEGKRYVSFDVTVANSGDDEYNVMSTKLTVQHNNQVAQRSYMAGDALPDVQLPPGGSTTFTAVYEVGEQTGKLQVSVQPNVFASDTVYFTGKF